jgi:hypothetical protein
MERINLFIEIQTEDEKLGFEIMKRPKKIDTKVDLPASAIIMKVHPSVVGKEKFLLSFGARVAPGLLANSLYEKIKGRATKLLIDRIEVPINKSAIERFIADKIESK